MAEERMAERSNVHVMPLPVRARRRELPPLVRRAVIALFGAMLGLVSFYLLHSIGR